MLLLPARPLYLGRRLLAQVVLLFVFLFALGTVLCFPVFSLFGTARCRINRYRFQPSCRKMRTQPWPSCLVAAGKLCGVLLLNLNRCANRQSQVVALKGNVNTGVA